MQDFSSEDLQDAGKLEKRPLPRLPLSLLSISEYLSASWSLKPKASFTCASIVMQAITVLWHLPGRRMHAGKLQEGQSRYLPACQSMVSSSVLDMHQQSITDY